ncbi:622_t:CDS:2 [Ambispora leptoticha]|uniref:622_t:CDS:1 n=1 Tax=Ambispora leptoticha TaxID=144679 RepID=A0A9N9AY36_9GLOM|nr:622_t:CDS:2 [Ambispora leptoticha]
MSDSTCEGDFCELPKKGFASNDDNSISDSHGSSRPTPYGGVIQRNPQSIDSETTKDNIPLALLNDPLLSQITLQDGNGNNVPVSTIADNNKIIGFYFGATWCPPYRSEAAFEDYVCTKPWLNIPYKQESLRQSLMSRWSVSVIPTLVIYNPAAATNKVVTTWGKSAVLKNPDHCIEEWRQGNHGISWLQLLKGSATSLTFWIVVIFFVVYFFNNLFDY